MRRFAKLKRTRRSRSRRSASADRQKRIIRAILIMGALTLLIIFFFGDHGLYQLYRLRSQRTEVQTRINELRKEKQRLKGEKIRLETDYKYIEQLAREKYRMAKKGEKVYKVLEKKKE